MTLCSASRARPQARLRLLHQGRVSRVHQSLGTLSSLAHGGSNDGRAIFTGEGVAASALASRHSYTVGLDACCETRVRMCTAILRTTTTASSLRCVALHALRGPQPLVCHPRLLAKAWAQIPERPHDGHPRRARPSGSFRVDAACSPRCLQLARRHRLQRRRQWFGADAASVEKRCAAHIAVRSRRSGGAEAPATRHGPIERVRHAGGASAFLNFSTALSALIARVTTPRCLDVQDCTDQGLYNLLVYTHWDAYLPYTRRIILPIERAPSYTLGHRKGDLHVDADGRIRNDVGQLPPVVHQFAKGSAGKALRRDVRFTAFLSNL